MILIAMFRLQRRKPFFLSFLLAPASHDITHCQMKRQTQWEGK